jgi:hypothetical protein
MTTARTQLRTAIEYAIANLERDQQVFYRRLEKSKELVRCGEWEQ